jgi:DNA gyrase subunit A
MVNDHKLEGISDIRDESDRDGMRIVIELKRDAYPRVVLNNLYKQTPIQTNFGCNMLALVNGEPQLLTLKKFLSVFLDFRIESITRRTRYELRKAEERDHLLQGLLIALANLDAVIRLIRGAADSATAKQEMIDRFQLSELQSDAILQMQLRRLTALEADKIHLEHDELTIKITDLKDILARRERILEIIQTEIAEIRSTFATPRRTLIEHSDGDLEDTDLIANEKSLILVTEQGYIKRMPVSTFETQSRATRGKKGTGMKEEDAIEHFLTCCDHDTILLFSDRGVVYTVKAYQIPVASRTARGMPIVQMLPIPREEKITSVVPVSEFLDNEYLIMLTQKGFIKKTALSAFASVRANGLIAISLEENDKLRWVRRAKDSDSAIIGTRNGMTIHFRTDRDQLRPLGRATRGVKSMSLKKGDELISMDILPSQVIAQMVAASEDSGVDDIDDTVAEDVAVPAGTGPWILVVTTGGLGKRVPVTQFRLQNRAGMGVLAIKFRKKGDKLAALRVVNPDEEMMIVTNRGIIIRQAIDAISSQSRMATGVRVQKLDEDDAIMAVAIVPASNGEDDLELEGDDLEVVEAE